jgi:HKD family nuclease
MTMRALVAKVKISSASIVGQHETKLKVLLQPEDEKELAFLKDALETCEGFDVSAALEIEQVGK